MIIRHREDTARPQYVLQSLDYATRMAIMDFDAVEWDEGNLDHATSHGVSAAEIEQAISNAVEFRSQQAPQ